MANNGNQIFNIDLTFHGEPAGMSARLSHVRNLSIDELAIVAGLLDKLVNVGRDYVRATTPKPTAAPEPEIRAEPLEMPVDVRARRIPREFGDPANEPVAFPPAKGKGPK